MDWARQGQIRREEQDRRDLQADGEHDGTAVAGLHEAEQGGALADEQADQRAAGERDAAERERIDERRPGATAEPVQAGAASPSARMVAPAKFSANSVPIVGIAS